MAIHEALEGIEVTVCVNGEALKEYPADNDQIQHANPAVVLHHANWTVTQYIESFTDSAFSIKVAVDSKYKPTCPRLSFLATVDGVRADEPTVSKRALKRGDWIAEISGRISGVVGGDQFLRPFQFSVIQTTSGETEKRKIQQDAQRLAQVGEIVVKIYRLGAATNSKKGQAINSVEKNKSGTDFTSEVHEKALKGQAKSHGVSLRNVQPAKRGKFASYKILDGKDHPLAAFVFKYRSIEALKQLHVIERTPEPEPSPLDGLNDEQRRRLEDYARYLRFMKENGVERKPKFKRESENDVDSQVSGKRRCVSGPIDLTDDGDDEQETTTPIIID